MKFLAEIRQVVIKKLITNDKEIRILLNTSDLASIELARIPSEEIIQVEIKTEDGKSI